MKTLTLLSVLLMSQWSFAKQVQTDCPMMSESNSRRNTKSDLSSGSKNIKKSNKSKMVHR